MIKGTVCDVITDVDAFGAMCEVVDPRKEGVAVQ